MKRILFLVFFIAMITSIKLQCMEKKQEAEIEGNCTKVGVSYADSIPQVQANLMHIRSMPDGEKEALFKKMPTYFPLVKAIEQVNKVDSPQVVLWFTSYFGCVSSKAFAWNKENIFKQLPKATFWLTDLKAWQFLSVDAEQLAKNCPALVEKMKQGKVTPQECPLVDKSSSDVLDESVSKIGAYRLLSSQAFFKWLMSVKEKSILSDDVANRLCKDKRRPDTLPYSLSTMGFRPALLNRTLDRYKTMNTANMLEVDFSLVYPVLQYLEGVYYAAEIIKSNAQSNSSKVPQVVFLLHNKEFAFYLVDGEKVPFQNFKESVTKVLKQEGNPLVQAATIQFMPFAYGKGFYDAPYKLGGKRLSQKAFLTQLSDAKEKNEA